MKPSKYLFVVASLLLFVVPVSAHRNPTGCLSSSLGIVLYVSPQQVAIGDTVTYSAMVYNGTGPGPVACDATAISASVVTPDGTTRPIVLDRTTLLNRESNYYPVAASYVARAQDVTSGNILAATASVAGDIHQNDTDSRGGGLQGVVVTVSSVSPTPAVNTQGGGSFAPQPKINVVKVATPTILTSGPGLVAYTYSVTNTAAVSMIGIWVKDDKCTLVTYVSGDTDKDTLLTLGETWLFTCSKMLNQTETNIATAHGQANGWDTYDTDTATVVVSNVPPPTAPASSVPPAVFVPTLLTPSFPNAGIEPMEPSMPLQLSIPAIAWNAALKMFSRSVAVFADLIN